MSSLLGCSVPVLVFDSMQVYAELPVTTNQVRSRRAELVGVCSVLDEWSVARHVEEARTVLKAYEPLCPLVLDAGSGMYLNAMLLDIPLYPKVTHNLREKALSMASGKGNVRRESRRIEIALSGARQDPGSIWDGDLRYDTTLIYLRPEMEELENRISERSSLIVNEGLPEVRKLLDSLRSGVYPNASVRDSIGFRELKSLANGEISAHDAEVRIRARTRKLARRQIRWFDKLSYTLRDEAEILTLRNPDEDEITKTISGIFESSATGSK